MFRTLRARWRTLLLLVVLLLPAGCLHASAASPLEGIPVQPGAPGAAAEPVTTPAPRSFSGAELAALSLPEQLHTVEALPRDQAGLRRALDPSLDAPEEPAEPRIYEVGDRIRFWVHNSTTATNDQVDAELVHRTDRVYAWVSLGSDANVRLIKRAVDNFSETIYPRVTAALGGEPNPGIDGDPRLHILHTTGMGWGVAGYFSGSDANSATIVPHSNEKEMFYISLDWLQGLNDSEMVETVLAHEFQHMVHFNHDRNEEVWINEGLSEYAQEVAGYDPDTQFADIYSMQPDTQLNTWEGSNGDNGVHYGAAYLFVRYLAQRFGPEIASALVSEPANGIDGVRAVLAAYDASFEEVFANWLIANALDDTRAALAGQESGRYGYADLDPWFTYADDEHDLYPVRAQREEVANFGVDLIQLSAGEETALRLNFEGATAASIADIPEPADVDSAANRFFWSGRMDDSEARLSRTFDLSSLPAGSPVELNVRTWWQIEADYDYGYVMASADGEQWTLLESRQMSDENPSGNALGSGYTGSPPDERRWLAESFDLSQFAGGPLFLRFSYVTDDAVNEPGWLLDDVRIDAIGYTEDFEGDASGWESQGWMLTDGLLTQQWLVQLVELDGSDLANIFPVTVDTNGLAEARFTLDRGLTALLLISAVTEGTTLPAAYKYTIELDD